MSIARSGMLMIGLFILLELMFCGTLFWQTQQAEQEAQREEHFKNIVRKTHKIETLCFEAVECLKRYAATRDKAESRHFDEKTQEIIDVLAWLKVELKDHKSCMDCLEDLANKIESAIKTMGNARSIFEKTTSMQEALSKLQETNNNFTLPLRDLLKNQTELVRQEERVIRDSPATQRQLRRLIRTVLAVGILANIVFAVLLFKFFTSTITSRLAVMVDNTQKFKSSVNLNEPLTGADEIAVLDNSFHDMVGAVLEAQQMRQTFVAMISHDLRTPLTNVQAYLALVSEGILGQVPDLVKAEAEKTERNVSRLIRLINDLLVLEKMEAGKMQMNCKVVYLEDIFEKSVEAIEEFAKQHEVKLVVGETNAEVYADPDRLVQVLINLASNAVKFSPRGESVEISAIETDNYVEVKVQDRGRGVPPEHREAIFEKYKQVKSEDQSKKGGTGLGLPICKLIVEQLGGSIGVESEEGKGSTFWFRLPSAVAS